MNPVIDSLIRRKSVRSFDERILEEGTVDLLIEAALQAPTAGNQILYTILDIRDQGLKDALAVTCDNQPFIAKAPLVLIFLADCRRWHDAYLYAGARPRRPGPGDLMLACSDALIAAQNTVVAAESLGLGSCYIGDIMENCEKHRELLSLDPWVFPAAMVVYGYPTEQQRNRAKPRRFGREYIVKRDRYSRTGETEARRMFAQAGGEGDFDYDSHLRAFCERKYNSDFSREMDRSVRVFLKPFTEE